MKFVFASYVNSPGYDRPETWLSRIKAYVGILESLSRQSTVISIEQINYQGTYSFNGVQYHFLNFKKEKLYFPGHLHRFIKKLEPDVIVIQGLHFPLQVIQLHWLLGKKIKIIIQNHAEKPFAGLKKYLQRLADRYIHAYLFASREMGEDWVRRGNLASVEKIHEVMEVSSVFYPVDRPLARSKTKAIGNPFFLWVGRLDQNKDPLTVIKAFLKFIKVEPLARLYMIYHTEELLNDIKDILKQHADGNNAIQLVGRVPHDDMLYWFNSANFIISGSHYEGSGAAVCEAMSCGCIPVVTDIFSFRMMTANGKCGLLFEAGNEDALFAALKQTVQIDVQAMQNKVMEQFRNELSFDAIAGKIQRIATSL